MNANELMVGNWVEVISNDHLKYVQIAEIYQNSILTKESEFESEEVSIDNIKPIPIIPEILERMGFHIDDWSDDAYEWSRQETPDERMFVSVYMDDPANFFVEVYCQYCHVDGIHVKYVHELQNALKLCGIEKTIEP